MSRTSLLAALLGAFLLASCAETPLDQAVYDDFKTNFLSPEKWDEELAERRADRGAEKLAYLREVVMRINEERLLYAKRCDTFNEPKSNACDTVHDLNEALTAIDEVEMGLGEGQTLKGTLGEILNYNLDERRLEARTQIAKRIRKHFILEPE